jgi:hypothetical protein
MARSRVVVGVLRRVSGRGGKGLARRLFSLWVEVVWMSMAICRIGRRGLVGLDRVLVLLVLRAALRARWAGRRLFMVVRS